MQAGWPVDNRERGKGRPPGMKFDGQLLFAHFRKPQRFLQLAVGQQTGVTGDLAAAEAQLQPTVKTDPQIIHLRITNWVLCQCGT